MDKFIIEGGRPLEGSVRVNGSKNAALPMMAAALLSDGTVTLHNVPILSDIDTMAKILAALGVEVTRKDRTLTMRAEKTTPVTAPYELVSTMRASFCVLGPLLARRGRARVALPGGCVIGVRPVDLHIKGLTGLGAEVSIDHGYVVAQAKKLRGGWLYLGGAFGSSVTGTANVMMAATLAEGTTVIENAACEPEVEELALLLNAMGARIEGVGTHRLTIHGVEKLGSAEREVIPDRIEAGTFLAAAAACGGDVRVEGARADHLAVLIEQFRAMGIHAEQQNGSIRIISGGVYRAVDVVTLPYPGFPTDLQAQMMAVLSVADGISVVQEKIYPDRFMHAAELGRMGARIRKEGDLAVVQGIRDLNGAQVMASDLRGSAALVVAGLRAKGKTEVTRVYHIDRGYERIEERFQTLGAKVRRTVDKTLIVREPSTQRLLRGAGRWAAAL